MGAIKHAAEHGAAAVEEPQGDPHVPGRLRDLLGVRAEREVYLSTEEAAQLVSSPSREAFRKWARRHNVPLRRVGARGPLRVKKADLDWALRVR